MLSDELFQLPSPGAKEALTTATTLERWCVDEKNIKLLTQFSDWLVASLRTCSYWYGHSHSAQKRNRETMWGYYHQLRTSKQFKDRWGTFLQQSVGNSSAVYQYISHAVFKELIKQTFDVGQSAAQSMPTATAPPMTKEEKYALRYVAGYICKKVRVQLEGSVLPHKDTMISLLMQLCLETEDVDDEATAAWINSIDRGGLTHVSNTAYNIFAAIEEGIRLHLSIASAAKQCKGSRQDLVNCSLKNENVQLLWNQFIPEDMKTDLVSSLLLKEIVELYVTVRDQAFVSSCMELYKQLSSQEDCSEEEGTEKRTVFIRLACMHACTMLYL